MLEDSKLKEILLGQDYVSAEDIQKAEDYAKSHRVSILEFLLNNELISRQLLHQAIAEHYNLPFFDLSAKQPDSGTVLQLPQELARSLQAACVEVKENETTIALSEVLPDEAKEMIAQVFELKKIKFVYSDPEEIFSLWTFYRPALETRFSEIIKASNRVAPEIIDQILEDALVFRASDIHCEPQENEVLIRFRVDGVLQEAGRIPTKYYENIVNRIKVQAKLRIDEHQASQDGAIHYISTEGKGADLRVSIVPTLDGEKVVIRLLSEYVRDFALADLGMSPKQQSQIIEAAHQPFGMILVTGPTGSGKTTTLYALIKLLNDLEVNITTIEDPVEYKIQAINQIQVNPLSNLTFAKGLRAIARQDPNIILVGEIRDFETADIAVNAALTGHLLLSTFHANDSASVVPRLLNMEVEPFLLASTLELVVAQRLVRKICDGCKISYNTTPAALNTNLPNSTKYFPGKNLILYKGKGCRSCNNTGFKGRVGIYEFLKVTPEMEDLILTNPSSKQIWELAARQGAKSLFEDGVEKVKAGITTLEELLRVAKP